MRILIDGHDITLTGGIERFSAALANAMTRRGHRVFLFTYAPVGSRHRFALDPDVRCVHYLFTGSSAHLPGLRRQILDCRPDVFVSPASYNNHLLWCAALEGSGIPWIYSERNDPCAIIAERWNAEERSAALRAADRIHFLLEAYRDSAPLCARNRVRVIPNAVSFAPNAVSFAPNAVSFAPNAVSFAPTASVAPHTEPPQEGDGCLLLSLGRLHGVKQNALLLDAFALLASEFPRWRLEIWGDGEERARLQRHMEALGLRDTARLCGPAAAPEQQYARADLFCIPSRYEGFPHTLLEAMASGLPVAGFAGCAAVNGIVRPGETGLLAPEMHAQSLAATLRPLMADADLRRRMGENGRREASTTYAPERVFDAWEALLEESAACKGATRLQHCLSGTPDDPETARYAALLRDLLRRDNVLLRDDQRLRRLLRRYPGLRAMAHSVRQYSRRLLHTIRSGTRRIV